MLKVDPKKIRVALLMGNAVMTKAIMIMAGWYFGGKLDQKYGTAPWLMVLGISLGIGLGMWYILIIAKKNSLT